MAGSDSASGFEPPFTTWRTVNGDPGVRSYSALDQIHRGNVHELEVAWVYRTGDVLADHNEYWGGSTIQSNPIIIDGWLYSSTPTLDVIALNAATGEEIWRYSPWHGREVQGGGYNRGVAFWQSADGGDRRLFYTVGNDLICIDAWTGKPVLSFGQRGRRSMDKGLIPEHEARGGITAPAAPVIYEDLVIIGGMGGWSIPGNVSAFNVITGEREWIFHCIPHPGEVGYDSWGDKEYYLHGFGANPWGGLSVDPEHGLVFFSVGQAKPDLHRQHNPGDHLFGNSVVAVDAGTGEYRWHFQEIRHDLWDMEPPAAPMLVDLDIGGERVPGVIQVSKTGNTWLFHRLTGEVYTKYEEKPVPPSPLEGEYAAPTQKWVTWPEPFSRQFVRPDEYSNISPESEAYAKARMARADLGWLVPPNEKGIIYYGVHGGAEWPGGAFDEDEQVLFINANQTPWYVRMREEVLQHRGAQIYAANCTDCHGWNRGGVADSPALTGLNRRYGSVAEVENLLRDRSATEPGYPAITPAQALELSEFLMEAIPPSLNHPGARVYQGNGCVECHGARRQGGAGKDQPTLLNLAERVSGLQEVKDIIRHGRNAMKPHPGIPDQDLDKLAKFLLEIPVAPDPQDPDSGPRYSTDRFERFLDPEGYPATRPPWGTMNAVDLKTGKIKWQVPLGEYPALRERGIPPTGTENFGGPVLTAGGLVFIGAAKDEKLRAFDKHTGKVLWEHRLPAGGYTTPSVYAVAGRQFVVIPCGGGGKPGTRSGDAFVAFALPGPL